MTVPTSRTILTYGTCLPRPDEHQAHCPTRLSEYVACQCNVWWRGRVYVRQWNELGYTRIDAGPPYGEEEPCPPDESACTS